MVFAASAEPGKKSPGRVTTAAKSGKPGHTRPSLHKVKPGSLPAVECNAEDWLVDTPGVAHGGSEVLRPGHKSRPTQHRPQRTSTNPSVPKQGSNRAGLRRFPKNAKITHRKADIGATPFDRDLSEAKRSMFHSGVGGAIFRAGTTEEHTRLAFLWKPEIDGQEEFCAPRILCRGYGAAWPGRRRQLFSVHAAPCT